MTEETQRESRRAWVLANTTVFLAGACLMAMEVNAGRLVARYLGQSLYSWTSVIGVVLAGFSLGNYLGGHIADRFRPRPSLTILLCLASVSCLAVPLLNDAVNQWRWLFLRPWPVRILITIVTTFALPAALLGTINPIIARMAVESRALPGRTIGTIYAWGTIGSIAGTFLAGFWLIALLGTRGLAVSVALILAATALGYGARYRLAWGWALVVAVVALAAFAPGPGAAGLGRLWRLREPKQSTSLFQDESQYQYVHVKAMSTNANERGMYLDKMLHSEIDITHPTDLKYRYAWVYEAILNKYSPGEQPITAFVLGGGGLTFPLYVALTRPGSEVDVAEIDPMVTEAARQTFGFDDQPGINVFHMDARNLVSDLLRRKRTGEVVPAYDYIFGDAINDYSVPYHLTTVEFAKDLRGLMSDQGMYLLNMIERFDSGQFLASVVRTLREVFPSVKVLYCHRNLSKRGTFVVVCAKGDVDFGDIAERVRLKHPFFGKLLSEEEVSRLLENSGGVVLTDDYAPVENLLAAVVREDRSDATDVYLLQDGLKAASAGELERAIGLFEKALDANPGNVTALYNLGVAYMQTGEGEKALQVFAAALRANPEYIEVRNNAAVVLAQMGMLDEAAGQLKEILRLQADNIDARLNLASIAARQGRVGDAQKFLAEALQISPEHQKAGAMMKQLMGE